MDVLLNVLPWVGGFVLGFAVCFAWLRQTKEPQKPVAAPGPSAEPLRLLAVLQRDARLVDFLLEDIRGYGDEDVGRAVREIHAKAQAALQKHLVFEPVLPQREEESVTVGGGFDPSLIRLTGDVTGPPPFTGTLKHAGWRVKEIKLGPTPGQDEFVIMPADVHLG
jgi:hypothetical protein